jgi:hypothetical protein
MSLDRELEASLREFATSGAAELCENGSRVAPLAKLSWEVRGTGDKPLLHIWSEEYNLTRRVLASPITPKRAWSSPWNALAGLGPTVWNLCVSIFSGLPANWPANNSAPG